MKTILFLSPTGTFDNGAEISIFNLQKHLVTLGYNVVNVCPVSNDQKYFSKHKHSGIKVYPIDVFNWWWEDAPGASVGNERVSAYYYRDNISQIRKIIRSVNAYIVVTNSVNMFQGAVAAACEGIRHFWLIHEFPIDLFSYYRSKIDFIEDFSDELFSVAGALNKELSLLFHNIKVREFIPFTEVNAVEHTRASVSRIVSVGRITDRKNQIELITAYHKLNRPEIELVFIGDFDKDHKEICDAYINKNKLKNVTFISSLEKPWDIVTDKDLFVSTSKMEAFPLVYVEALLNGIPAIVSDNPGHISVHHFFETGQLYRLGNIDELIRLMANGLDNFDDLKKESLSNTAKVREKYSINAAYQEIISAIEDDKPARAKSIRHLANLVTLNENYGSFSGLKRSIKNIFKRLFNTKATK